MTPQDRIQQLTTTLQRVARLQSILGILGWDEQVNMPPGGAALRAEQQQLLADLCHREATRPELGALLDALAVDAPQLAADHRRLVELARKEYDERTRIPAAFVARRAAAQSRAYHAWVAARQANDFAAFRPHLEEQLALVREQAAMFGHTGAAAYDYWIDKFDPGMTAQRVDELFGELSAGLLPLVRQITAAGKPPVAQLLRGFPIDRQERFLREVVARVGFDFGHGRLDVAVHPFCGGHPRDVRMTTRYHADNPLDSLTSSLHETGHALYEQGLPAAWMDTPLGEAAGMATHESQSRLWENQVGRSRAFWSYWEPRYRELFGEQLAAVDSDTLYRAINEVAITPIRVDADEVTYNLHIMLRFALEKRLIAGDLAVADLPAAWNALSADILGYTPASDREGCLQDVHWSGGAFGYFPSYCLGNMMAAQLWYRLRDDLPDIDAQIAAADYAPLLDWLRTHVHAEGRRLQADDLALKITGQRLTPQPLLRYLRERYLPLYC
jgi:carboxypeptidase Taq